MRKLLYCMTAATMAATLAACSGSTAYNQYMHTPIAGWEKNDTLSFEVSPLAEGGHYKESLGLRITDDYPFMGLTLIVEQTVYHQGRKTQAESKRDTINCQLITDNGTSRDQGISYSQYNFPINIYEMQPGDSIHMAIRHDMKREILPGVSDIGIKITKMK